MKMKQQRELLKKQEALLRNPPYKHTCNCMMSDFQYLQELPQKSTCVNSKYYERTDNDKWIDVTDQVNVIEY